VSGTLYSNLVSQVQSHITVPCSSCMFQWKIQSSNKGKDRPQGKYQNRKSHNTYSRKWQCLQPSTYHKRCIWTISVIPHIQYYEVLALMTSIKTTNGRAKLQQQWWWQLHTMIQFISKCFIYTACSYSSHSNYDKDEECKHSNCNDGIPM